jgi:predicted transcriptional regulator
MIQHMQVLIELDAETLRRLEAVAPGRSRKRSAFIRAAVQKALWELEEEKTRRAYLASPDGEAVPFDATTWEPMPFGGFDPPGQKGAARRRTPAPGKQPTRASRRSRPTK